MTAQSGHNHNTVTTVAMKVALVFAACFVFVTAHPLAKSPYSACEIDTSCGKRCASIHWPMAMFLPMTFV